MRVRVHFRYSAETGEVEEFRVDDLGTGPVGADHDRRHERAAFDAGRVVERNPLVEEIVEPVGPAGRIPDPITQTSEETAAAPLREQIRE